MGSAFGAASRRPPPCGPDDPLPVYLAALRKTAADQPTADHYLRLARWQSWAGETGDAIASAEKAIEIDPGNIPAREFLVTVASDTHRRDLAEQRLREIMALDPRGARRACANSPAWRRRTTISTRLWPSTTICKNPRPAPWRR